MNRRYQINDSDSRNIENKKLNIIFLSWEYPPRTIGGIASHVEDLSRALAELGHRVSILTPGEKKQDIEYDEENGVEIFRIKPPVIEGRDFPNHVLQTNFKLLEQGSRIINSGPSEIDLIHAHDWLVFWAGQSLKHIFKKPLLATIHATEYGRNNGLHNQLQYYINDVEWYLTFEAWKVICCSEYMLREVTGLFDLPQDKVVKVPNGVVADKFVLDKKISPEFRQKYAAPQETIVYFIGRLVREKGVQVLIEAAPKVLEKIPEVKFVISGTGPYSSHLKYRVDSFGLNHKFYFTGFVDNKTRNQLYHWAETVVFPSLYEPFGIVVLEGMATETPVIASDVGGMSEIINDGYNGYKVMPDNPGDLANKIINVLSNPQRAERIAANASEEIRNKYSWKNIAQKTAEIYQTVQYEYKQKEWQAERDRADKIKRKSQVATGSEWTAYENERDHKGGTYEDSNNGWR